ncbi:KTSC domain-containing protein, partial [Mesorhizobium sp. M0152]
MPSTSIRKTEYDPERKLLSVWFVASGKRYQFEEVPPETFA